MSVAYTHSKQIREILSSIYGLTVILEDDGCRESCDDEQAVLRPFEQGTLNTAIKHLANHAELLAEAIEEEEQRLAELAAQRDDREGKL